MPRRPAGAYAAVVTALLLAAFALVAHHGSVPRQALQAAAPAPAAAAAAETPEVPHAHPAPTALSEAAPSGHDHGGQDDCGPASGTCQSAKAAVDVALPPRARLVLPGPAPRPLPLPHAARAAPPTPPELAELSILRI
ncbi:DUF6153 family protein [Nocardiopsis suaedae]|uniref:DUF6153 family protein n=1 Tax=Nocardiopsis suaedae TaxID=3018444 RepID=UPI0022E962EE|nr:DUF6153 family protein [Nocardiopsis suaedae]